MEITHVIYMNHDSIHQFFLVTRQVGKREVFDLQGPLIHAVGMWSSSTEPEEDGSITEVWISNKEFKFVESLIYRQRS